MCGYNISGAIVTLVVMMWIISVYCHMRWHVGKLTKRDDDQQHQLDNLKRELEEMKQKE